MPDAKRDLRAREDRHYQPPTLGYRQDLPMLHFQVRIRSNPHLQVRK